MVNIAEVNVENIKLNCVSNPIYQSRFQKLEKALNDLFLKELNSADSIFIKISPDVVKKIAVFLSGMVSRPVSIGFCGETASGKSTIVLDSIKTVRKFTKNLKNSVTRINTDDYYYDRSEEVKLAGSFAEFTRNYDLDTPQAIELKLMKEHIQMLLNNQEVFLPKYDMSGTAKRFDSYKLAKPSPIIIAEGIYALNEEISDIFDFKIYVDVDKSVQKERFFERAKQRNLGDAAYEVFENAFQKARIYVHPCAKSADIILSGEKSRKKYCDFISSLFELKVSNYYNFAI